MTLVNSNYLKLPGSYLFSEIARRVAAFRAENPDAQKNSLSQLFRRYRPCRLLFLFVR